MTKGKDQHEGPVPENLILVSVTGSHCYGLSHQGYFDVDGRWEDPSDVDTRGVFVLTTKEILKYEKPEFYVEQKKTDDKWFEIEKFFTMLAKGNAEANEMLASAHHLQFSDDVGELLIKYRNRFLGAKNVLDSWGGYSTGQMKLVQRRINEGKSPYKAASHMLRLLYMGIQTLEDGFVNPNMTEHKKYLMDVKMGKVPIGELRMLQRHLLWKMDRAYEKTKLQEHPDIGLMNDLLLKIRLMYL